MRLLNRLRSSKTNMLLLGFEQSIENESAIGTKFNVNA